MVGRVLPFGCRPESNHTTADDFACLIAFDTDDPEFTRGWECGQLWARLEAKPEAWEGTYHASNRTMIARIATALGYVMVIDETEDPAWIFVAFWTEDGAPEGSGVK